MLQIYNTLAAKKEILKPIKNGQIHLFVCGPTVYDLSHIGHAKTYVFFDLFAKYLKEKGFKVFYLQNITDIDDKIIKRAAEKNTSPAKLAKKFEKAYLADAKKLGITSVDKYARATDYIKEIISQVKRLAQKGFAYAIEDGVYYDIAKFKDYGKLSGRTAGQAKDGVSRIDEAKGKKNKGDFCLWKLSKPGEPRWPSPFGTGRPGWHIEDTAITEKYFGPQYDIHGGGQDLMFPHHEAEISQMEAISGKKPMVKYWMHIGFLTANGEKMSKSLGNFVTIEDFFKNHTPRTLRFFFAKNHYRSPVDYSENAILQAEKELKRIDEFINKVQNSKLKNQNYDLKPKIAEYQDRFQKAMEDDLNTPEAIAAIFDLISKTNKLLAQNEIGPAGAKNILKFLKKIDKFLGFIFWSGKEKAETPKPVLQLLKQREKSRQEKNWLEADELRKEIEKSGYKVEDTPTGPTIKKI